MAAPRASIGVISIGEMGLGIVQLLISQNYRVLTNITGRRYVPQKAYKYNADYTSKHTFARAATAPSLVLLPTDAELVAQSDYILSIVPPKDAIATARRIAVTWDKQQKRAKKLVYLDLNAVAPSTARSVAAELSSVAGDEIGFVDGGIIGGPPKPPKADASAANESSGEQEDYDKWTRPSIVVSGPDVTTVVPQHLLTVLRGSVVGPDIGTASGLKCCFASLSKGFTALAIQSFTTAARLGVLDALRDNLKEFNPAGETRAIRGLTSMPHKAGRWVKEMEEIGKTFKEEGGWSGAGENIDGGTVFGEIAEVYRYIAEDTVLGSEKSESRVRGKTAEDVVDAVLESRGPKTKKD
jgi:3-hydroxyisobutyrate dehydrogenase-like beta-hydroxyacid dehydrogenase